MGPQTAVPRSLLDNTRTPVPSRRCSLPVPLSIPGHPICEYIRFLIFTQVTPPA